MKLLFCVKCNDMFKLSKREVRECECGYVRGKYKDDGRHALTNGNGMDTAISNASILAAIHKEGDEVELDAWMRPSQGELNPNTKVGKTRFT